MSLGETIDAVRAKHSASPPHNPFDCEMCAGLIRIQQAYEEMIRALNVVSFSAKPGSMTKPKPRTTLTNRFRSVIGVLRPSPNPELVYTQANLNEEPDEELAEQPDSYQSTLSRDSDYIEDRANGELESEEAA